jgi:hypothetical protein
VWVWDSKESAQAGIVKGILHLCLHGHGFGNGNAHDAWGDAFYDLCVAA